MNILNKTFSMAAIVLAACGVMSSCTSDDDITGEQTDDKRQNAITTTLTFEYNATETRTGINHNGSERTSDRKIRIYQDDYIWAYSANAEGYTKGWYNKLVPSTATYYDNKKSKDIQYNDFTKSNTELVYTSIGEVHYKANDALLLLYGGNRANQDEANAGEGDADIKAGIYTLKRNTNDHHTAYIYGNGDGIPYSDAKNNFSFRAAYGYVSEDGSLSGLAKNKTDNSFKSAGDGTINLVSYMPLIMFGLPAVGADNTAKVTEVNNYLAKLDYKIMVDAVPKDADNIASQTTKAGYPQQIKFKVITDATNIEEQKCVAPYTTNPVEMSATPLRLHYKPNLTAQAEDGSGEPSSWLWNTNTTSSDYDCCAGYVYVPIPPADYYLIRVAVKVDNSSCDDDVKNATNDICGIYTMVINGKDGTTAGTFPNIGYLETDGKSDIKSRVNAIYDLGDIWTRTTALGTTTVSGMPKKSMANTAMGWTFTPNGEFDW